MAYEINISRDRFRVREWILTADNKKNFSSEETAFVSHQEVDRSEQNFDLVAGETWRHSRETVSRVARLAD